MTDLTDVTGEMDFRVCLVQMESLGQQVRKEWLAFRAFPVSTEPSDRWVQKVSKVCKGQMENRGRRDRRESREFLVHRERWDRKASEVNWVRTAKTARTARWCAMPTTPASSWPAEIRRSRCSTVRTEP